MGNTNSDIDLSHALERKKGEDNKKSVIKNDHKSEFRPGGSETANWMMRHSFGIIKNENQANIFLVIISIIVIVFAIIFVFGSLNTP